MRTVLIVDDEATICRLVKMTLESTGEYQATVCTNGGEALEQARTLQPDVVLLDVKMPGVSGSEIAEQLRGDPMTSEIPFIFLTGMVEKTEVEEGGHKIGGNYFVGKPFRKPELLRVIDLVLGDKKGKAAAPVAPVKEKKVHVAKLLGYTIKIKRDSDGYFQMAIIGLKPVKGGITFFNLKDAQEASHALIHYHVEGVQQCTCNKKLEWLGSDK
jgi:CheY-like chemotaxis protein